MWWRRPAAEPELPVRLPEVLLPEVRSLLAQGKEVDAVRLVRRRTGLGLLLAVRAIDALGPEQAGDGPAPPGPVGT